MGRAALNVHRTLAEAGALGAIKEEKGGACSRDIFLPLLSQAPWCVFHKKCFLSALPRHHSDVNCSVLPGAPCQDELKPLTVGARVRSPLSDVYVRHILTAMRPLLYMHIVTYTDSARYLYLYMLQPICKQMNLLT